MILIGGEPSGRRANAGLPAGRPGAALKDLCQRQRDSIKTDTPPQQFRQPVQQRHRQRAPLDHQRRRDIVLALDIAGIAKHEDAGVDEQAAVAVFRKPRQAIDVGHLQPGALQRLNQRIGQPLGQLVQRHQFAGGVFGRQIRVTPAIAQWYSARG